VRKPATGIGIAPHCRAMTPETPGDESRRSSADDRFDYSDQEPTGDGALPRLPRMRNPPLGTVPPPISRGPLLVRASAWTDVGLGRDRNEDAAYVDVDDQFFIVADGGGGRGGGALAELAVDEARDHLERSRRYCQSLRELDSAERRHRAMRLLDEVVHTAHDAARRRAGRDATARTGTTLDIVLVIGADAYVAHVGNGRTYLIRDDLATQLTIDHGISAPSHVLVNAVGARGGVHVELVHLMLQPGDKLLLCTDGLHACFSREELVGRLARCDADRALRALVDAAMDGGADDDLTGIVAEVVGDHACDLAGDDDYGALAISVTGDPATDAGP